MRTLRVFEGVVMWLEYFRQYMDTIFPAYLREKPWNYKNDLIMCGCDALYHSVGSECWHQYIRDAERFLLNPAGNVINWKAGEHNVDKISFGKSLRLLRDLQTDDTAVLNRQVKYAYGMLLQQPRTSTGNFWHKDIYPEQVWLDGLYMAMPFYAQCLAENGENRWNDIINQFVTAHKLLWDPHKNLYRHGYDASGEMKWADPVSGQSPSVWLRAEGWYLMALCDVYETARDYSPRAEELAVILRNALEGLMQYQDPATHMFFQVTDRPDLPGNYPETSGSAMAAYACMKGARLHMTAESFWKTGSEILDGICMQYLRKEKEQYHLYGICASAGLGTGPDPHNRTYRSGLAEYYIQEPQIPDNQHGTGACMLAAAEQLYRRHGLCQKEKT